MKKLMALVLALLLCGTALAAADGDALFPGHWEDTVSQRAWLRIDRNRNDAYDVRVFWGSGVYECDEWTMTGVYDPRTQTLVYTDGCHYTCTYDDSGNTTGAEAHYVDAVGTIYLDDSGFLRFACADASLCECRFVWYEG